jgi:hypothetical protein
MRRSFLIVKTADFELHEADTENYLTLIMMTAVKEDNKDNDVYKHPVTVSAVWNLDEGDYTYWVG